MASNAFLGHPTSDKAGIQCKFLGPRGFWCPTIDHPALDEVRIQWNPMHFWVIQHRTSSTPNAFFGSRRLLVPHSRSFSLGWSQNPMHFLGPRGFCGPTIDHPASDKAGIQCNFLGSRGFCGPKTDHPALDKVRIQCIFWVPEASVAPQSIIQSRIRPESNAFSGHRGFWCPTIDHPALDELRIQWNPLHFWVPKAFVASRTIIQSRIRPESNAYFLGSRGFCGLTKRSTSRGYGRNLMHFLGSRGFCGLAKRSSCFA